MQVTIKPVLPWGNYSVQTITLSIDAIVDDLQEIIYEKFKIPIKQQILKYKKDNLILKLISGWPLSHYKIKDKDIIHLEKIPSRQDTDSPPQDAINTKVKGGYFFKLGIVPHNNESEIETHGFHDKHDHFPMTQSLSIDLRNCHRMSSCETHNFRLSTALLSKQSMSVTCDEAVEALIKEVKNNNLKNVMAILVGADNFTNSFHSDFDLPAEESIDSKAKRLINQKGIGGWSAFHWAIYCNHIDLVAEFLNLGADHKIPTEDDWMPLNLAIYRNNVEVVKLLVNLPTIDLDEVSCRGSALHIAAKEGRVPIVSLLIEKKAKPCIKNKDGFTAVELTANDKIKKILQEEIKRLKPEVQSTDDLKLAVVKGWMYKKHKRLPAFNKRYLVLNPWMGTLITFQKERHVPNRPKKIVSLSEINVVRTKKAGPFFDKRLFYIQIERKSKHWVLGFHEQETAQKWITYLKKSIECTILMEKKIKTSVASNLNSFSVLKSCLQKEEISEEVILYDGQEVTDHARDNRETEIEIANSGHISGFSSRKNTDTSLSTTVPEDKVCLGSFEILKEIGAGSFGKVYKARKKDDGKIYALKTLHKRTLIAKNQLEYAVSEATILKECKHPFIVGLKYTFQTQEHLILVLDYCPGGDLTTFLCNNGTFFEDEARLIIAELVLAIEYLHSMNIIYRDLKPENILIGNDGHIKLTDFGLSKRDILPGDFAKSFCGSPAYLAPEMLASKGVDRTVDLYGIGTVLYELLTGRPPYYSEDFGELYQNIKKGNLCFPSKFSKEVKNLLQKLLEKCPERRLGAFNMRELKNDPFFAKVNWNNIFLKKTPPFTAEAIFEEKDTSLCRMKPLEYDLDYCEENFNINRVGNFSFAKAT